MVISGKDIAAQILTDLKQKVDELKQKGITPKLAVVLMGDVESSAAYVRQKELKAKEIGAEVEIHKYGPDVTNSEIEELVRKLDKDPNVHGIILQRPAPKQVRVEELENLISSGKEVDGFGLNPVYDVPVAMAVILMLEYAFLSLKVEGDFLGWLKNRKVVVIGRGETAGMPIINSLKKKGVEPAVIDSKTQNRDTLLKDADVIISAVGKTGVVTPSDVKKGVILIDVGMHSEDGKLHGDFEDEEMENIASFYTPTPGGVGPVNVAQLLKNLVLASQK